MGALYKRVKVYVRWPDISGKRADKFRAENNMRYPVNSVLTRERLAVLMDVVTESGRIPASKHEIQPECRE